MGVSQPMPEGAVERLAPMLKEAHGQAEYQRVQCVWLRATLGLSSQQIAAALGWRASSVRHVQARYLRGGEDTLGDKPQGGRYHAHLTREEQQELLAPFLERAQQGEIVIAAPVQQAYAERLGYPVPHSVVYRALHRQGWRKVQPRPQHPKADLAAQEECKKSFRNFSKRRSSSRLKRVARSGCCSRTKPASDAAANRTGAGPPRACGPRCRPRSCASTSMLMPP